MATKTSIIIKSVDENNKAVSRSVTDVSNTATNSQLQAFAEALNDTSVNTYQSSSKVQTTDLDTEEPTKLPRNPYMTHTVNGQTQTITGAIFTDSISGVPEDGLGFTVEDVIWDIDYQGDRISTCYTITDSQSGNAFFDTGFSPPVASTSSNKIYFGLMKVGNIGLEDGQTATFTIHADESSTYEALDFVVTIQGGNG